MHVYRFHTNKNVGLQRDNAVLQRLLHKHTDQHAGENRPPPRQAEFTQWSRFNAGIVARIMERAGPKLIFH